MVLVQKGRKRAAAAEEERGRGKPQSAAAARSAVTRSFVCMALCFALNLGCVTSVIPLARTTLGPDLAHEAGRRNAMLLFNAGGV